MYICKYAIHFAAFILSIYMYIYLEKTQKKGCDGIQDYVHSTDLEKYRYNIICISRYKSNPSCKCRRRLSVLIASLKSDVLHLYILCRVKSNEGIRTTWITSIKSNTKVIYTKYHGIHKNSFMIPCKDLLANRLFKSVLKINYSNYE